MYRAFNIIGEREEVEMTPDLFLKCATVFEEVLRLRNAPFNTFR